MSYNDNCLEEQDLTWPTFSDEVPAIAGKKPRSPLQKYIPWTWDAPEEDNRPTIA